MDEAARKGLSLKASALAEQLGTQRHYMVEQRTDQGADVGKQLAVHPYYLLLGLALVYDPRFLVFEFSSNIVLRKAQVHVLMDVRVT